MLSVLDSFNFSEALKGEHLDYDRPEERVVLRPGRRAHVLLDLDFITFCRDEELLTETVAYDIAKQLNTTIVEILLEDFTKLKKHVCVVFTTADPKAMAVLDEYDTAERAKEFPEAGRYKKTEELKAVLRERLMAEEFPTASKAFGYPITPEDRFKVYPLKSRPMLDGYKIMEGRYKPRQKDDDDSSEDSFEAELDAMDKEHDAAEKARLMVREPTPEPSEDGDGAGKTAGSPDSDSSPGSPGSSPGSPMSPGGVPWSGLPGSSPGSPGSGSGDDAVGAHWNDGEHEYPEEVRVMLAEIEESLSATRPLVCRRPWCRAKYSAHDNRSDACLYHPGEVRTEYRPPTEAEVLEKLGGDRRVPRSDGTWDARKARRMAAAGAGEGVEGAPETGNGGLSVDELVEVKIWSCCGQPYVDLHNLPHDNPHGEELDVGKHYGHIGGDTSGFRFRIQLPCTRCPHADVLNSSKDEFVE